MTIDVEDNVTITANALTEAGFTSHEAEVLARAIATSDDPYAVRMANRAVQARRTVATFVDLAERAMRRPEEEDIYDHP